MPKSVPQARRDRALARRAAAMTPAEEFAAAVDYLKQVLKARGDSALYVHYADEMFKAADDAAGMSDSGGR
ncbi:hypothetical protein [Nonomuraea sp. CA-141351]|uniref:hypothetical protein n=1 Tax=Nonomuraea sp. CA-141351 TaxID=3239996 RepID=UPI003D89EABA